MAAGPDHLADWGAKFIATTIVLLLVALAYARAWSHLRRKMPGGVPAWRLGAFLAGIGVLWLAWNPDLSALTHLLLIAHMVQHLLFMLFAPPLLLLGSPIFVFACGWNRRLRAAVDPGIEPRRSWARRIGRALTHPMAAGLIMVVVTIAWHTPRIFALAMDSHVWHEIENLSFFACGLLFWWPVILPWPARQQWPRWSIPIYLLGSDMPVSVLTAYLAFCGYVVYPAYLSAPRPFGISALDDQVAAAMLMWVVMLVVFLAAAAVVVVDLLDPSRKASSPAEAGIPTARQAKPEKFS